MKIRIQCACGTRYGFEMDPPLTEITGPLPCPNCATNGAEIANQQIRREIEIASAASHPIPTARAIAVAPAEAVTEPVRCSKHAAELAAGYCFVCEKPICPRCMEQFGYLCSHRCKDDAARRKLRVPICDLQRSEVQRRSRTKVRSLLWTGVAVPFLLVALWLWYDFVATQPGLVFQITSSSREPFHAVRWIDDDHLMALSAPKLALFDASAASPLWTAELKADERSVPVRGDSLLEPDVSPDPLLVLHSGDAWVATATRAICFDLATGKRKAEIPFPPGVEELLAETASIAARAAAPSSQYTVARLDLNSGKVQTETVPAIRPVPVPGQPPQRRTVDLLALSESFDEQFLLCPSGVLHWGFQLLERRFSAPGSVRMQEGKSSLDRSNLRASDSTAVVTEFMNQPKGPAREDLSRYRVVLRRVLPAGGSWEGEVTGTPFFCPLKSIHLLLSGRNIQAFNPDLTLAWQATVSSPLDLPAAADLPGDSPTFLESSGRIYLAAGGVLRAFDVNSGALVWELPDIGVATINADDPRYLYLASDLPTEENANPRCALLQVNRADGVVTWEKPRTAHDVLVSREFLYATYSAVSFADEINASSTGTDAPVHFRIRRINPKDGSTLWDWDQPRRPRAALARGNQLLIHGPDEVKTIRFFSF